MQWVKGEQPMNILGLYQIIALALATAAISVTISKAVIFASLREWIEEHNSWFGELINCHYCTSHWVAMAFVAMYRPVFIQLWIGIDLIVSLFCVVAISAIVSGVIIKLTSMSKKANPNREGADNLLERNNIRSMATK